VELIIVDRFGLQNTKIAPLCQAKRLYLGIGSSKLQNSLSRWRERVRRASVGGEGKVSGNQGSGNRMRAFVLSGFDLF
jgi:hypothetical protein